MTLSIAHSRMCRCPPNLKSLEPKRNLRCGLMTRLQVNERRAAVVHAAGDLCDSAFSTGNFLDELGDSKSRFGDLAARVDDHEHKQDRQVENGGAKQPPGAGFGGSGGCRQLRPGHSHLDPKQDCTHKHRAN